MLRQIYHDAKCDDQGLLKMLNMSLFTVFVYFLAQGLLILM